MGKLIKLEITEADRFKPAERLERKLREGIVGQEWAVKETIRRFSRRLAGISNPELPVAVLFIAGPTGVGKTEFAKVLAKVWREPTIFTCPFSFCGWEQHELEIREELERGTSSLSPSDAKRFWEWLKNPEKWLEEHKDDPNPSPITRCPLCILRGDLRGTSDEPVGKVYMRSQSNLVAIDCSQLGGTSRHNISKLIGAPAGYVGYGDRARFHPRNLMGSIKVVLFDEFEKGIYDAYGGQTDFVNLLLRILDEGKIEVSTGEEEGVAEASFSNCIIVFTSNIGSKKILEKAGQGEEVIGFLRYTEGSKKRLSEYTHGELKKLNDSIYDLIRDEVKNTIAPELYNRIAFRGRLIVFRFLTDDEYIEILSKKVLNPLRERLEQRKLGIVIEYTEEAKKVILKETGDDREYGARPLEAIANKRIVDKIADFINCGKIEPGDRIIVKTEPGIDEDTGKEVEVLAFFAEREGAYLPGSELNGTELFPLNADEESNGPEQEDS